VGNTKCYSYDALHRITRATYSRPYAPATPTKCFVYDSATVNGQTMLNTKGRLAEAYTKSGSTCDGTGKITDLGFSYSPRGEVTDVYESTPNSGGYYHSSALHFANGAPCALAPLNSVGSPSNGLPCPPNPFTGTGLPVFTYSLDGEGRPNAVGASSGTNPILSSSYNAAGQLTGVTFGTYDSETFQYDGNTGRMTQYKSSVGATPQAVTGGLTWNSNGSLAKLSITDQ
jgi:hypothetical protein